jgi:uncharacterized protein (TIRG00374 family)
LKKKLINLIKFAFFFGAGIGLFWYVYKDFDFIEMISNIKNEVNFFWIILSLFCGLLSHFSRTLRWNMLIAPLGKNPRTINTFLAVMVAYFANLALPRMGEISRCGIISKYEGVSFPKLVGTVVMERVLDLVMLLIFMMLALITQFNQILLFLDENPKVGESAKKVFASPISLIVVLTIAAVFYLLRKKFKNTIIFKKIDNAIKNFSNGFKAIKNLENKWRFILHTVFIWVMYYMMTYLCFFAFEFTSGLAPIAGLTVFVLSSIGMVLPVQGGMGAWHFFVIGTLMVYLPNVPNIETQAASFAFVVHGAQTSMIIVLGAISVILLPFFNEKKRKLQTV